MNSKVAKKIRQLHKRSETEILDEAREAVRLTAYREILNLRQLPLKHRIKFCSWLLWGRGEWKGF